MGDTDIVKSFNRTVENGMHNPYKEVHVRLVTWERSDIETIRDEINELREVCSEMWLKFLGGQWAGSD